jgi:LCP family protein required for cell wall assembly
VAVAALAAAVLLILRPDGVTWAMRLALARDATVGALDGPPALRAPMNILVVGSDARGSGSEPEGRFGNLTGARADVILVVRVAAEGVQIVSVPRDLRVTSSDGTAVALATLLSRGDPSELVEAVRGELDVPLHHYVEIDFAGVAGFVESIGGIPLHVPHDTRDERSGLVLAAGTQVLDGATAVAYLRARSPEEFVDGQWRKLPADDLARIQRHQEVLGSLINDGLSAPGELRRWLSLLRTHASADATFTPWTAFWLARRLDSVDPDDVAWFVLPVEVRTPAVDLQSSFEPEHVGGRLWLETRPLEARVLLASIWGEE